MVTHDHALLVTPLTIAGGDNPAHWRRLATRLGVADRVRFVGAMSEHAAATGRRFDFEGHVHDVLVWMGLSADA